MHAQEFEALEDVCSHRAAQRFSQVMAIEVTIPIHISWLEWYLMIKIPGSVLWYYSRSRRYVRSSSY